MRRNLMWLLTTLTVVVLLFGYRTSRGASTEIAGGVPAAIAPSSTSSGTAGTARSARPSSRASATTGGSASSAAQPRSTASATPSASRVVTGDEAQTEWGPVEVRLTIRDGRISKVDVPVYPNGNPRDYQINSYALPTLVQETIQAQSAQIDMVSGATVTSGGYLQSLQSALDKAGLS